MYSCAKFQVLMYYEYSYKKVENNCYMVIICSRQEIIKLWCVAVKFDFVDVLKMKPRLFSVLQTILSLIYSDSATCKCVVKIMKLCMHVEVTKILFSKIWQN